EILIIDEVLAVGDAEFQKKCLGKMEDVSKSGRTILFVSHQLGMVSQLCKNVLLLEGGNIVQIGRAEEVINSYTRSYSSNNVFVNELTDQNKVYSINSVKPLNARMEITSNFAHNELITLEVIFSAKQNLLNTNLLIAVNNKNGQRIFSADKALNDLITVQNQNRVLLRIPSETLTPGSYSFFVAIHCPNTMSYDSKDLICPFTVFDNGSAFVQYENKWFYGDVFVKCEWEFFSI
ncbi:MAG: Wzt carbohydrate-binding domain-containing protein, partial [Ignavibacterium sp.]|nr:Wzt carbohydrate-binding domain-containing protein [Ignavibacterium sp.]